MCQQDQSSAVTRNADWKGERVVCVVVCLCGCVSDVFCCWELRHEHEVTIDVLRKECKFLFD